MGMTRSPGLGRTIGSLADVSVFLKATSEKKLDWMGVDERVGSRNDVGTWKCLAMAAVERFWGHQYLSKQNARRVFWSPSSLWKLTSSV